MKKLNIGCGRDIKKGYVNLDVTKIEGVDIVHNLNKFPYPFKDNTFGEIYASHVIEHIEDFKKIMNELHRILRTGGKLIVRVPHFSCSAAFYPHHKIFFKHNSFANICRGWQWQNIEYKQIFSKFQNLRIKFYKGWHLENYPMEFFVNFSEFTMRFYEDTFLRSLFPAFEIYIELIK